MMIKHILLLSFLACARILTAADAPIWRLGGELPADPAVQLTKTAEWIATPLYGNCIEFHGNGSVAVAPGFPQHEFTEATLSLFFRINELPKPREDGSMWEGALLSNDYDWLARCYSNGSIYVGLRNRDGDLKGCFSGLQVELNRWYHLAAVWDGANGIMTVYIDGEIVGMRSDDITAIKAAARPELTLGGDPDGGYLFGSVADLRIYDRAMPQREVLDIATQARPPFTAPANFPELHCFVTNPYSEKPILPWSYLDADTMSTVVSMTAARDEYESATFTLRSAVDRDRVQLEASALTGPGGATIPAADVDLKLVKCWYQGPFAWRNEAPGKEPNVMVPELLLNDTKLVVVDEEAEKNFLRISPPDADEVRYFDVSDKTDNRNFWQEKLPITENQVFDAETLQPLPLAAGRNQQFFLTVRVDAETVPGDYSGTIRVLDGAGEVAEIAVKLKVLPFVLSGTRTWHDIDKPFITSVYYVCNMQPDELASISNYKRSEAQMRNEMKNLKAHGILWPLNFSLNSGDITTEVYQELFRKELRMRRETGLELRPIYLNSNPNVGLSMTDPTPENLAQVTARAAMVMDIVEEELGHRDVYFYGLDEARGEEAERGKPFFQAIQAAGARVFNSGYRADTVPPGNFALVGDVLDLLICAAESTQEEAAKWHSKGHDVWNYAYPQSATENPAPYRRNFGMVVYKSNYDGLSTFCYWMNFGHPWNDFDSPYQRELNFVYPTADGVVDTVHFAGCREGFDDIRYASTMLLAARDARKSGDPAKIALADAAEKFLAERDPYRADVDETRAIIIDYILQLTAE